MSAQIGLGTDMNSVTAVSLRVVGPNVNTERLLPATILSVVSSSRIKVARLHATDGSDFASRGVYRIRAILTVPSGQIESEPFEAEVVD
jgi:hypothetical protein